MSRTTKTYLSAIITLALCGIMLFGCSNPTNPAPDPTPSVPASDSGTTAPSNPDQDWVPDGPEDDDDDTTSENDSSFMDGDDHLSIPF